MNYYNRYPAHYLAATLHLSMEQDGAYNRLMDWAYSNEAPIPDEKKYIIGRAQNSREKRAINDVLSEFFLLTESGWTQKRIEAEISKASPKIEAARINGLKGGRPPKQKPSGFPENNPVGFQNETQQKPSAKAPQTPYTNQEQNTASPARSSQEPPAPAPSPTDAGRACLLMREAGCIQTNPSHPDLLAAIAEGVTPEVLGDTAAEAIAAGKTKPFAWAISTARSRRAEGARPINGESHADRPSGRATSAVERVRAANARAERGELPPLEGTVRVLAG